MKVVCACALIFRYMCRCVSIYMDAHVYTQPSLPVCCVLRLCVHLCVNFGTRVGMYEFTWMFTCIGWRRPIGCLKLRIIFRKRATNCRALLRKMTYEDKASYDSAPPCMHSVLSQLVVFLRVRVRVYICIVT